MSERQAAPRTRRRTESTSVVTLAECRGDSLASAWRASSIARPSEMRKPSIRISLTACRTASCSSAVKSRMRNEFPYERRSRRSQFNLDFPPQRPRRLAQCRKCDRSVRRIQQAVHGRSARFHAGCHLRLGEFALLEKLRQLGSQRLFHRTFFHFIENSVFLEKIPKVTSASGSFAHNLRR